MKVLVKIAWRNIWRNKVRSLVIITSIVMGVWAGTFVSAIYYGMGEDRVTIAIQNEISHIQVHHPRFKDDYKACFYVRCNDTLQQLLKSDRDFKAWSPRSKANGMVASPNNSVGIQINGVDPYMEDSTTHLAAKLVEGKYFENGKANQVLISAKTAEKLKLKLRSKLVLTFLDKDDNMASGAFKVAGIFRSENSTWDEANVFVRRQDMNVMLGLDTTAAHEIAILLKTNHTIDSSTARLKAALPAYRVESWMELAPEVSVVISMMAQVSVVFVVIILLALSFGIVNTMLMAVLERTREIGMMIALGMTRAKVFTMVVFETFFLVMLGCPAGVFIAAATITFSYHHGIDLSAFAKGSMQSMGFSAVIHPDLPLTQYRQIVILVIITALLSAVFPAIKAVRLNPAETIKS
jgi:ABC-type lipoprotein release transport system permease subunit